MKVQVLRVRHKGFAPIAWIIRLIQRTKYSHYALGFVSRNGNYMILDATSKNVAIRDAVHFFKIYDKYEEDTIDIGFPLKEFESWYENLLGERYGYLQLLGILIKNKRLGRGIVCNELVLRFLRRFTTYNDSYLDIRDLNYTYEIVKKYRV